MVINTRLWVYPVLVAAFVSVIAVTLRVGEQRFATSVMTGSPASTVASTPAARRADQGHASVWSVWSGNAEQPLARLILQIIVIVIAARLCGAAAHPFGQPPVIGEIAAGIALGPSLLGAAAPQAFSQLFPPGSLGLLQLLA